MDVEGSDSIGKIGSETLHLREELKRLIEKDYIRVIKSAKNGEALTAYADEHGSDMLNEALDVRTQKISAAQMAAVNRQYSVADYYYKIDLSSLYALGGEDQIRELLSEARELDKSPTKRR